MDEDPGAARLGNFINYYQFNPAENRLKFIPEDFITKFNIAKDHNEEIRVLDIGCNSGVSIK